MSTYPFAWPDNHSQPVELSTAHRCPFATVELPSGDTALLATRYEDVRALLADPTVSKNRNRPDVARMTERKVKVFQKQVNMDPPAHTRMRRLIGKTFTASRVDRLRPRITEIVDELLAEIDTQPTAAELNSAFSFPLTIRVICEMLGVTESEHDRFGDTSSPPWGYMADLIERKRMDPGPDLISALIEVSDEDDGRLSSEELHWWSTLLLLAGYETTAHQLSGAVVLLLSHPDQLDTLRSDWSLIDGAVEELLRCQVVGTSLSMLRYVTENITVGGYAISRGSSIVPSLECANHDPTAFPNPDVLDITRRGTGQMTFSAGQHFCVGAPLARAVIQIALERLLRRFPTLTVVDPEHLDRVDDVFFQGFRTVPVTW